MVPAEPQVPAHRKDDHLRREPEAGERRARRSLMASRSDRLHAAGSCPNDASSVDAPIPRSWCSRPFRGFGSPHGS
jgi:hypothetical protein